MQNRKMEKDYRNIEDQIRCLKLRMFSQQQAQVQEEQEQTDVTAQVQFQTEELAIEQETLERHRGQLEQRYQQKKQEYIRLNNLEGELHSQMADLRTSTSDQMMQNKGLDTRLSQENKVA